MPSLVSSLDFFAGNIGQVDRWALEPAKVGLQTELVQTDDRRRRGNLVNVQVVDAPKALTFEVVESKPVLACRFRECVI